MKNEDLLDALMAANTPEDILQAEKDFPPEDIDPPIEGGGAFDPIIDKWNERVGSTTIIN